MMIPSTAVVGQKRPLSAVASTNTNCSNPIRALLNQRLGTNTTAASSSVKQPPQPSIASAARPTVVMSDSVVPAAITARTVSSNKPHPYFSNNSNNSSSSGSGSMKNGNYGSGNVTTIQRPLSATSTTKGSTEVAQPTKITTSKPAASNDLPSAGNGLLHSGEDDWDETDYLLHLHRDMHRVHQIHNAKVGDKLTLEELKVAKRVIDRERNELKQRMAPPVATSNNASKPQNSILAKLASEKKTVLGGALPTSTSTLGAMKTTPAPITTSSNNTNTGPAASYANNFHPVNKIVGFTPGTLPNQNQANLQQHSRGTAAAPKAINTIPNLLTSQPAKNGEHYVLVGETIMDLKALQRNANQAAWAKQAQERNTLEHKLRAKAKDEQFLSEIDQLLKKKSSHASEAELEKDEVLKKNLQVLEKREFIQQKASEVTCLKINAFQCMSCQGLVTELYPDLCKEYQHAVRAIKANKRFFKCKQCGKRDATLVNVEQDVLKYHPPPNRACYCGANSWMQCGLKDAPLSVDGTTASRAGSTLTGEKLISSASEWTSGSDKMTMAARVSRLD
jgi:hypothetical protein